MPSVLNYDVETPSPKRLQQNPISSYVLEERDLVRNKESLDSKCLG